MLSIVQDEILQEQFLSILYKKFIGHSGSNSSAFKIG